MEGIWLVFVILSLVVSAINKKSKQEAKKQQAQQPAARPAQAPRAQARPAAAGASVAKATKAKPPEKRHEAKPLEAHMHTPVMGMEGTGTEGEDCCHAYMLDQKEPALPILQEDAGRTEQAQALLQGVIFSEILGRRAPVRYGRKQA